MPHDVNTDITDTTDATDPTHTTDTSPSPVHDGSAATRRGLLAGAAALGGFVVLGRAAPALAFPKVSERAWRDLDRRFSGALLRPGSSGFRGAAQPNNLLYADRLPAGIARCRTARDVATAITWCREHDVPLAPRGGGHSYAGYSTTRGLLVDLAALNEVSFDENTGRVTAGAGVKNRKLYEVLAGVGVSITHGRCYGVGVGGFLLGGGIGFNMRLHGVGSDKLVETDVVDAAGVLRKARDGREEDLLWACRGGAGGNFGINTRFVVETFDVDDITVFDLTWSRKPEQVAEALIPALQRATRRLGSKITLRAVTPQDRREGRDVRVSLLGQLHGPRAELLEILAPVFAVAPALKRTIRTLPYWEGQKLLTEEGGPEHYKERSRFVDTPFDAAAFDEAFRHARRFPGTGGSASLKLFQTGKTMNEMPARSTAFVHRRSQWLFSAAFTWHGDDDRRTVAAATDWLDGCYQGMLPFCGEGALQNFPDPALADWKRQYYGVNLARLRRVKAAVDPDGLFRFPQSIPPAA